MLSDFAQFLRAYFHQDWMAESASFREHVRLFARREPREWVSGVLADIEELLRLDLSEDRLRILILGRFQSEYDPSLDLAGRMSMAEWLREVHSTLQESTSEDSAADA